MPINLISWINMDTELIMVYPNPLLGPDWYQIADWKNPRKSAIPVYLKIHKVLNRWYAHPELLNELKKEAEHAQKEIEQKEQAFNLSLHVFASPTVH